MTPERWATDEELRAARQRFSEQIPGYAQPAAYGVARVDGDDLTFGHVNDLGGVHLLPAAVLASVCGYVATTATFRLTRDQLSQAVERLSPAEAAEQWDHPNLWSWRELLESAGDKDEFIAVFVRDPSDPPVDSHDALFRSLLRGG